MPDGPSLLRSRTFRFTLIYLCLFVATALVPAGVVYWAGTAAVSRQIDSTIDADLRGLAEQYRQRGLLGLLRAIRRRSSASDDSRALYLLTDHDFKPLAGNLAYWPEAAPDPEGWITFRIPSSGGEGGGINVGRARVFYLDVGINLLVGHDIRERSFVESVVRDTLVWGLLAIVALSLVGSVLFSRFLLARIDRINATAQKIVAGDLSGRVPETGSGDEFDGMARNLNAMLDRISRLVESLKQVSDNIAHDLRSPLTRMRSRLEVALMRPQSEADYREILKETIDDADRLLKTFNALLSIAQAESGAIRVGFSQLDLRELIQDVAELYEPLAEQRLLSLRVEQPDAEAGRAVVVSGDRGLVFQALSNLIENAIKFSEEGGTIVLALICEPARILLTISDSGPGIPADMREKVKERFFRLESSRTTPGSGLGLSLAAAVARLHGGELVLEDNAPGLRASLCLPVQA